MSEEILTGQVNQEQEEKNETQESQKDANVRILRERAETERKAREAAEQRVRDLEEFYKSQLSSTQKQKIELVEEDDDDVQADSYIEGRHLKKTTKQLKDQIKKTQDEFSKYKQEADRNLAEQRIKIEYPDFYDVVNEESLKNLQDKNPIEFEMIMNNQDHYKRLKLARNIIERYGLNDTTSHIDKKIEENRLKPRTAAGTSAQSSDSPLAQVSNYERRTLSKDRVEALRRMADQIKGTAT